ncbi:MAG TPA: paraquat-inducible protein A [Thermohalobaculum sp.]|nr:paraquat-inducible protein A [Thermohalobaculum sp.]
MIRPGILRPVVAVNLLLLTLYPVSWIAPLARAGFLPFFSGNEITILGGVNDLWQSDAALATLVAVFAIVIPYAKTLAIAAVHFGHLGPRALPVVEIIGKLSMADVFLIALYIVLVKGVGIGHVASAWGLWLFTGCVLASLWVGFETKRKIDAKV